MKTIIPFVLLPVPSGIPKRFIGVHLRSSAVSRFLRVAAVLAVALVAGGAEADTVMLADGQPLMGELRPGGTAGELRLVRYGESPVTLKREDVLAIDFGRVRGEAAPIAVTLHTGDRLAGPV